MGVSVGTYYVLSFWDSNRDKDFTEKIILKFQQENPEWGISKALAKELARMKGIAIGQPAPAINTSDASGSEFKLDQWKGKMVLIDFWASWCLACRVENPKLVEVYQVYHEQGLEVLGITRDTDREAWEKAVEKDQLPWTQIYAGSAEICDQFGVNSLPQNVLIDQKGIIVAKNVTAEELEGLLEHLIN